MVNMQAFDGVRSRLLIERRGAGQSLRQGPQFEPRSLRLTTLGGVLNWFSHRVVALKPARQGAGRWEWLFPFQGLQRRLAGFKAQPEGPGLLLCRAALLEAYLE